MEVNLASHAHHTPQVGLPHREPVNIERELDQDWKEVETNDRLVPLCPIPMNKEQKHILRALKKKDGEYLLEFCRLAWSQGKDMSLEENLRTAIENASLDWKEAKQYLDHDEWQEELELNRLQLIKSGLWGVPSFRLTDNDNKELFSTWGRDRIWLLTHELQHYSNSKDQGDQQ